MYTQYPKGEITIWCYGRDVSEQESGRGKRKKETESASVSRRQEKEEVDAVYKQLKEKHGDAFDTPKLRLWANGSIHKKPRRQESLSDALCNAAVTFDNAFSSGPPKKPDEPQQPATYSLPTGISPSKSVELRMKNFQQLRYL